MSTGSLDRPRPPHRRSLLYCHRSCFVEQRCEFFEKAHWGNANYRLLVIPGCPRAGIPFLKLRLTPKPERQNQNFAGTDMSLCCAMTHPFAERFGLNCSLSRALGQTWVVRDSKCPWRLSRHGQQDWRSARLLWITLCSTALSTRSSWMQVAGDV